MQAGCEGSGVIAELHIHPLPVVPEFFLVAALTQDDDRFRRESELISEQGSEGRLEHH
ncbi:hypothetical protein BKA93DRAFT_756535 [Sparassis latifolia]